MKRIDLVAIDLQRDFIEGGNLPVTGGKQACINTANLINRLGRKITNIYASLDSHQPIQSFSPHFWLDKNNQPPGPYAPITYQDVVDGKWRVTWSKFKDLIPPYLKELESKGRYTLTAWPLHCQINTEGWLVEENFGKALTKWEVDNGRRVQYIPKGNNQISEAYSAFESEVVQLDDPTTSLNMELVASLESADIIVWTGLALSHCLKFSFESIANNFSSPEYIKKCVLLRDCTESVGGYEQQGEDFIKDIVAKGATVMNSVDFLK